MELLQLKYFCDACLTQNFSKTAKKYLVPASNISQSVSRLEKELGTNLFDRSANRIILNKNGEEFYKRISMALTIIDEAKDISKKNDSVSGDIRLCILVNRRIVTEAIEQFKKLYPEVNFLINHNASEEINNFDLIIADDSMNNINLTQKVLMTEELLLAVEKNNPVANMKNITAEAISKEKFISMSQNSSIWRYTNKICRQMGFLPDIAIMSDDPYYIRKYIEMGLGIGFVPAMSWRGQFSENIIFRRIGKHYRSVCLYSFKNKYMNNTVRLFADLLGKTFSEEEAYQK